MNPSVVGSLRVRVVGSIALTAALTFSLAAQSGKPMAGQRTFNSTCAACHGLDGRGGEHAPNIATEPRIQQMADTALQHIVEHGISNAGMPGFASSLNGQQISDVVAYLRVLQGKAEPVRLTGNPTRGQEIFFGHGECSACHMANGRGGFLGADLSAYSLSHSVQSTREAIVNPNSSPSLRGDTISIVTASRRKYRGLLRNEDNFSLQMQTVDGRFLMFDKVDLVHIDRESVSLMPPNYGSKLTGTEIDDLVAFLARPKTNSTLK